LTINHQFYSRLIRNELELGLTSKTRMKTGFEIDFFLNTQN
jgi:hypothetical protein